jgi:hypothetical protein
MDIQQFELKGAFHPLLCHSHQSMTNVANSYPASPTSNERPIFNQILVVNKF